jgi:hypothetical protein
VERRLFVSRSGWYSSGEALMQGNVNAFVFALFDMLDKRAKFGSAVSCSHLTALDRMAE